MFGEQFYPIPEAAAREMTADLKLDFKRILDPQAGKGDLLDYIKKRTRNGGYYDERYTAELYAIEKDPDLRQVLAGKGYKVLDSDFLTYNGYMYFDYILMNPPFKDGTKHLIKAWEVSSGALIRCLLNAETLRDPYTQERQQVSRLIEQYGSKRNLGSIFARSERPTDVEVVLVTLQDTRPKEQFRLDFDPATVGGEDFNLGDLADNALAPANIFESYEARHRAALAAFKELLAARQKVNFYLNGLLPSLGKDGNGIMAEAIGKGSPDLAFMEFLQTTTTLGWDTLFNKTKLSNVTTEGVRKEIEKMQAAQGSMSFTAANMGDLFDMLYLNRDQIMINCLLEAFDMLTKHYNENREAIPGWKTNAAYLVGKRFILPNVGDSWGGKDLDWTQARKIGDLEKALCFISGKKFENIRHVESCYNSLDNNFGEWVESEFFQTKLYKKRTMHFLWRDEDLRREFNARVARHRWGWMPEKVKQGAYM